MAIVDKYRNKLMSSKKNSLQEGLQNGTQNGLQDNLQDNTTNVENTEQNTEQNTSNNYWLNLASKLNGAVNKGVNYVTDSIKNNINEAVNSARNTNAVNNLKYQDYASLIDMKTANPKAELQTAMQRAQSASNAYLKALGLQGSGAGQSQLTDIGVQYQNALSKINQTAQDDVNAQLSSDFEKGLANGRYSAQDAQDFIRQYGDKTGKTEEWQNLVEDYGRTQEGEIKNVIEDLSERANNDSYVDANGKTYQLNDVQKEFANYISDQLIEANGNIEKQREIMERYKDFLNNPDNYDVYADEKLREMAPYRAIGQKVTTSDGKTYVLTDDGYVEENRLKQALKNNTGKYKVTSQNDTSSQETPSSSQNGYEEATSSSKGDYAEAPSRYYSLDTRRAIFILTETEKGEQKAKNNWYKIKGTEYYCSPIGDKKYVVIANGEKKTMTRDELKKFLNVE